MNSILLLFLKKTCPLLVCSVKPHHAKRSLNKITKTFNKNFVGIKSMLRVFLKNVFPNSLSKGIGVERLQGSGGCP